MKHGLSLWNDPPEKVCFAARIMEKQRCGSLLAAAFVAALRLAGDQPVSLLQNSDRLARGAQRAVIYTRPDRRQGPVGGTFGVVTRLD
ncbi:MAG: hypothetical protein DLM68_07755 [Hyphomicrobiales bacterium]|nr:MAG: hypothetical protein DLM68_07755 [Hyphomicrobiales bacterium]